tara:strand:- start:214 stop:402 length:189 start_codon:yes stop_codon:yes gene_type:complete
LRTASLNKPAKIQKSPQWSFQGNPHIVETSTVFDPDAYTYTETGFISSFAEPEEAAEFLTYR